MADVPASPATGPVVKCPTCGRNVRFDATSPFRPFCSERCRTADLGAWASESYRLPETTPPDGGLPRDNDD